jgi:drug/metabolite transporter (DMT)-like permease
MIQFPILGALSFAGATILQRTILKKRKINVKFYQIMEFTAIVLVLLPLIYFFWKFESEALQPLNIFIFFLIIVISIIANLFVFYSMKWERIGRLEPAKVLENLFVILLAIIFSFFFGTEMYQRNLNVIIPSIIAGIAIIFPHIKKHNIKFNKYFISAILGSFFFALELVISRLILDFYSPISFYFLRCIFVLGFTILIFRPKIIKLNKKTKIHAIFIGVFLVTYRLVIYYGYLNLGIIFTTLIIMLSPVFIYLLAWKFLREKLNWKNIASSFVIVGCVLYVVLN